MLSTGLDLLLIPWFQRRTGNGGVGAVLAFVASEVVVFGGAALMLPRRCLGKTVALDLGRALGAAGATALLFYSLPPLPIYVGVPACITVFTLCALSLGLVRRSDVALMQGMIRRKLAARAAPAVEASSGSPAS